MFSNFPPRLIDYKGLYYVILHMFIDKNSERCDTICMTFHDIRSNTILSHREKCWIQSLDTIITEYK